MGLSYQCGIRNDTAVKHLSILRLTSDKIDELLERVEKVVGGICVRHGFRFQYSK